MTAKWCIDEYLFDNNPLYRTIPDVFKELGITYHIAKYVPFAEIQDYGGYDNGDNVVLYGTIGYIKKCPKQFYPGAFGFTPNRQCNVYMSNIPYNWFLNSDYVMLTWGDLKARGTWIYNLMDTDEIFIRPVSGDKSFTGQTIHRYDFAYEINTSQQLTSVTDESIIMIAPSKRKQIMGEFRFIIGDGQVIAGSEYRWDGKLDVRRDYPEECSDMARRVAKLPWQLDTVYTCDVALMENGDPKIVELNSFASAGWYACDQKKVISAVTDIAEREFNGKL
jgi:hypothetical protein